MAVFFLPLAVYSSVHSCLVGGSVSLLNEVVQGSYCAVSECINPALFTAKLVNLSACSIVQCVLTKINTFVPLLSS